MAAVNKKIKPALKKKKEVDEQEQLMEELDRDEKGLKSYHWFLIYLGVFLLIVWIMFFKIIGITHMPNEDMSPRVDAGDLLLFYRLDREPAFQELVVFEKTVDDKKQMFVGRVIGAPGDTIGNTLSSSLITMSMSVGTPAESAFFRAGSTSEGSVTRIARQPRPSATLQ